METTNNRSLRDDDQSQTDLEHIKLLYGEDYIPYEWVDGGECVICRKPFEGRHLLSKITCGPKCRKRLQRLRQQETLAFPLAMHELQMMCGAIKRREKLERNISDLKRLKAEIDDLLHLAGDKEIVKRREMLANYQRKRP